ncbi:uncharacterized protein LOC131302464 [Rhododendron vialii]|uniref:uncharacterized protein LOC131302464 n=1 Tax=Rhododendron vialii TaxID=182163 RepID=UPI00265D95F3|nr:uncharacterized protein LOC131302464 [Rhododendron vialii]
MAPPLQYFSFRKVLILSTSLLLLFFTSVLVCAHTEAHSLSHESSNKRRMLEVQKEEDQPIKNKSTTTTKNQTKLIKPSTKNQTKLIKTATTDSGKNQTKLLKTTSGLAKNQTELTKLVSLESTKNKTKLIKPNKNSTMETIPTIKIKLKKLNSTSKASNSTKPSSNLAKKPLDLLKPSSPKNKTTKPMSPKQPKTQLDKALNETKSKNQETEKKPKPNKTQKPTEQDDVVDDLVEDFRDLPSKLQAALFPDLEKISTTSKIYLTRSHKEITKGFKPFVGTSYAPTIASIVSFAFILIPLVLVSLIFTKIKAYFSLQKILIFIHLYLSIYFSILCLSSLVTGLEPLGFFYATSRSTYVWLQVLQTLGYVLYLLLLLMYLVLVFATESGLGSKMLGLAQTLVGLAVGLHCYMTVFHRVVLRQPPRTNWRIHGVYAACFLVIGLLANADRRKKAYLEYGGEEAKKN